MKLLKLLTYTFDKNVGSLDRVLRILSGLALLAAGALLGAPAPWNIVLMVAGGAWAFTGVVSRCSIYYMFGHSSRRTA
jgi:hypothetical protein